MFVRGNNKLVYMSVERNWVVYLVFQGKFCCKKQCHSIGYCSCLLRKEEKCSGTNALAYFAAASVTEKKMFVHVDNRTCQSRPISKLMLSV